MGKAKTEVTVATGNQMQLPGFMRDAEVKVSGLEDMEAGVTTPRIQLAQAMSPQTKKKDESYIEGLEEGMFFNALTQEVLGESFTGYILKVHSSRTLFDESDEIDCYSNDAVHGSKHSPLCSDCPFGQWSEDGEPPVCRTFENLYILPEGADSPALLSIKQSNKHATKETRNLRTHLRLHASAGAFAAKYEFTAKMVANARGQSFYVVSAHPVGFVQDEDLYAKLAALAEQFADMNKMAGVKDVTDE